MRRFWLSFADDDRPKGQQFLGVCIVEVTEDEAARIKDELRVRFPRHGEGAEWMAAATRKAWTLGCNPGGEVATADITDMPLPNGATTWPLNRLLQKDELQQLGFLEATA